MEVPGTTFSVCSGPLKFQPNDPQPPPKHGFFFITPLAHTFWTLLHNRYTPSLSLHSQLPTMPSCRDLDTIPLATLLAIESPRAPLSFPTTSTTRRDSWRLADLLEEALAFVEDPSLPEHNVHAIALNNRTRNAKQTSKKHIQTKRARQ